jgi:hypothetical protein
MTERRAGGGRRRVMLCGGVPASARVFDCPGCGSPTQGSWTRGGMRSALCVSCQDAAGGESIVNAPCAALVKPEGR